MVVSGFDLPASRFVRSEQLRWAATDSRLMGEEKKFQTLKVVGVVATQIINFLSPLFCYRYHYDCLAPQQRQAFSARLDVSRTTWPNSKLDGFLFGRAICRNKLPPSLHSRARLEQERVARQ